MTWPIQDEADAFLTLLGAASGSPALVVCDGVVPPGTAPPYALVYFYIETPDGLAAADAVSLTFDSDVIDAWAYVHCVGVEPQAARSARAVAGRVRAAVLNQTLMVANRSCFPIRWHEGSPPTRNQETGETVFDQVDVYGWRSVPA